MGKGQVLYNQAKKIIPGGTQILSKRPEMHLPDFWPAYYQKAKGCEIWDLDGKKYVDMSYMGIGACVLGYADPDIDRAVKKAIDKGIATTLNSPLEVELTRLLLKIHPWADMARFALSGGEIMSMAVRIARAASGRDRILFCGYHGWHDWYLSSNLANHKALDGHLLPGLEPKGVPRALKGTAFPFAYNDTEGFLKLFNRHRNDIGAVVMEPIRNIYPQKGFLAAVQRVVRKNKAILILDEISLGFRLNPGGAHLKLGIKPDLAAFSKALGNGFPIAALIGRKEIMNAAQESFISSVNWSNNAGFAAAIATIKKYQKLAVHRHLELLGKKVQKGWVEAAKKNRLKIQLSGTFAISHFDFEYDNPLALKTLFTQEMLKRGFLATNAFYASYSHKDKHINAYLEAVNEVFFLIARILNKREKPEDHLAGKVCHAGFSRLT